MGVSCRGLHPQQLQGSFGKNPHGKKKESKLWLMATQISTEVINPVETVEPLNAEVATDIVHNAPVVDPEKEALEKQLEEMKAQMAFFNGASVYTDKSRGDPQERSQYSYCESYPRQF